MSNKISLSDIDNIIDNHFEADRNFVFVVDETICGYIMDTLDEVYGLEDEVCGDPEETIDEYYITVDFDYENPLVFCENARCNNGKYKYSEVDDCDYFVQEDTGMCEITADKVLGGEGCCWSWFEIVPEEDNEFEDEDCDCDDCDCCVECDEKPDDETLEEIKLIEHLAHTFEESECTCGACLRNTLHEAFNLGRQVGFNDCKEVFRSVVDHLD